MLDLVILAGGKGTRMGDAVRMVPKPMLPLAGRPLLEHQVELARRYGVAQIHVLTGHLGEAIEQYFGDGSRWGVRIAYHHEQQPLGTAGALKELEGQLESDFLVFYGDIVMDVDLEALVAFHRHRRAQATLTVHPNAHPFDSDLVDTAADSRVAAFHPKPHAPGCDRRNLVNAALYVLSPEVMADVPRERFADLGRDVLPGLVASGQRVFGYATAEYLCDVGTPERLRAVERDMVSGKVGRLNRRYARRAVFLDRDGVLVKEVDHLRRKEDVELLPGAAEAIRRLNRSEFVTVVTSNQPGLARGLFNENDLEQIQARLETLLGAAGAYLDRTYYCPHHPERGFPGERADLKIPCQCRKPAPGMLLTAAAEMNIDLSNSFLVGDRTTDIAAGKAAGCRTILVRTGYGGQDGKCRCEPDVICDNLPESIAIALEL